MDQNELMHYGKKGMRWGRRRAVVDGNSSAGGSSRTKGNSGETSPGAPVKFKTKKQQRQEKLNNDMKNMSDKELRERINRMQMEQQYKKMMTPEKSAARKQIEQILINEGKQIATQMIREEIKKSMSGK